jgi:competence protein ComEA
MQMPTVSRRRALAYAAVVLALLALGGRYALESGKEPSRTSAVAPALAAEPAPPRELVVHVVGAVRSPGLYRLPEGSRVDEAIQKAGGPKAKAALELVNLAAPVADGQQVVVPLRGGGGAPADVVGASGAAMPGGKVHLNSATLEELDTLPGVGPVTAQRILDYRTQNGGFGSVEELDAVSGIGPARLEQLKPLVDL